MPVPLLLVRSLVGIYFSCCLQLQVWAETRRSGEHAPRHHILRCAVHGVFVACARVCSAPGEGGACVCGRISIRCGRLASHHMLVSVAVMRHLVGDSVGATAGWYTGPFSSRAHGYSCCPCPCLLLMYGAVATQASALILTSTPPSLASFAMPLRALSKAASASRQRRSADSGLDNMLGSSSAADKTFVDKYLADHPELISVIARMCRDGDIERALARQEAKSITAQLGKALLAKAKKMKGLPPRLWKLLFNAMVGLSPDEAFEPKNAEALSDQQRANLCMFALNCTGETEIPSSHPGAGYEGPLMEVLKQVCTDNGNRLAGITYPLARSWGWVQLAANDPTKVVVQWGNPLAALQLSLPYPAEFLRTLNLTIEDNCFITQARLTDTTSGFTQLVYPLLQAQHPGHTIKQDDSPIERPLAAASFASVLNSSPAKSESSAGGTPSTPGGACPEMPAATPPPKRTRSA